MAELTPAQRLSAAIEARIGKETAVAMAKRLGVAHGTISDWRNGLTKTPNVAMRAIIEGEFGIPCNEWPKRVHAERVDIRRNWTGERVGKLTVISCLPRAQWKSTAVEWSCRCDCGATLIRTSASLARAEASKDISSCPECVKHSGSTGKYMTFVGRTFGLWTVKSVDRRGAKQVHARLLCECACGTTKSLAVTTLTSGDSSSCGCRGTPWRHASRGPSKDAGHQTQAAE